MNKPMPKRFIAGAVCPTCHAFDTIIAYEDETGKHCSCVECDYHELMTEQAAQPLGEAFIFKKKS